jgi:hypothetical protein
MSLAQKTWTGTSLHEVVLAWLRAERETNVAQALSTLPAAIWFPGLSNLLDRPNLSDPDENRARLRILHLIRNIFIAEIPPDTTWYEVHNLTDKDLNELYVVNFPGEWNDRNDSNELVKVARRKQIVLRALPSVWQPPILWGHDRNGPFTIIEGNKRLTAYAGSGQSGLNIPILVGLSPMSCVWHILDHCGFLFRT